MAIIEQKLITSLSDLGRLNIIDFNRCNGLYDNNSVRALQTVGNWLIGNVYYTIIQSDMRIHPNRSDFPRWNHAGNGSHERLGKLYWNMFHASFKGTLEFHDSPDFSGTFVYDDGREVNLWGDIGKVSASTFGVDVLPHMHTHDIWISIINEERHILLEPLVDVGNAIHEHIVNQLGIESIPRRSVTPLTQASLW